MRPTFLVSLLLLANGACHASVPLLLVGPGDPGAPPPVEEPEFFATRVAWDVVANVRGVAANALARKPGALTIRLPSHDAELAFDQRRFTPVAGFVFSRDGAVVVDPEASDRELAYDLYAVGARAELSWMVREGRTTARIAIDNQVYVAYSLDREATSLRWLDPARFPPDLDYSAATAGKPAGKRPLKAPPAGKYLDHIDVLVVHTAAAAAKALDEGKVLADIVDKAILDTNTAFLNSGIVQVRLRHLQPGGARSLLVNYNESPGIADDTHRFYAHRAWMRTSAQIAALRNTHQADLVAMILADEDIGGVAYIQRPDCSLDEGPGTYNTDAGAPCDGEGLPFAPFGFSASGLNSSTDVLSFPHEIGHNLGMEHNVEQSGTPEPSYPWSYAHWVSYVFGGELETGSSTLLSGQTPCMYGCPRRLQFSNPNIPFNGFPPDPSGTTAAQADGQGRYRFNARTAALLAPATSGFRGAYDMDRLFRGGFEALPDVQP